MDIVTLEAKKTVERYAKTQRRVMADQGYGAGDGARAITASALERLAAAVKPALDDARKARGRLKHLVPHLLALKPEVLSLVALQSTLHQIGRRMKFRATLQGLGLSLEAEAFAAGLTKHDPKVAKAITEAAKRRYSRVPARRAVAKRLAEQAGYKVVQWDTASQVTAGGWLLGLLLRALPDMFTVEGNGADKQVTLLPNAVELAEQAVQDCIARSQVFLPSLEPPTPWTGLYGGGPVHQTRAYRSKVVRSFHKDTLAQVKAAIRDGTARPAIDALNSLQSVAWRINERVLGVMRACLQRGIHVEGFPGERIPLPPKLSKEDWSALSPKERAIYAEDRHQKEVHNLSLVGERLSLAEDISTAELLSGQPFYVPMNMDWRGRFYAMCQFNFAREDRVRGLFLFDQGEAFGQEGLEALYVHAANCWAGALSEKDTRKSDKVSIEERIEWTKKNLDLITAAADFPLTERWWMAADAPWLFLAVCFEITSAMENGPTYVCRLPVSFDGSCSGLQHLSAMTRAPEGALVNLVPLDQPADIYSTAADIVRLRVQADAERTDWIETEAWKGEVAKLALAYGITRKLTKRNVMTFSYSSKKFGMAQQQQEDLLDPLADDVLTGKLASHPFANYARSAGPDHPSRAARYLASHTFAAIEEVVTLPAGAMVFMQRIAKALAHEGKAAQWITPSGLPWSNRYHVPQIESIELWLYDRGIKRRNQVLVATGQEATIDKEKSAAGIAPNVVHACDAAHLALTVNACVAEGIGNIATVHDSFGCLPSRAVRFNAIIREQFVRMYEEHDVLCELLEQARRDISPANIHRLPELPMYGTLDLKEVLNARYAFA